MAPVKGGSRFDETMDDGMNPGGMGRNPMMNHEAVTGEGS